jgi:CheY-like chemotaxis protein
LFCQRGKIFSIIIYMTPIPLYLILADDDEDDCFFFKEIIGEINVSTIVTVVHDGVQLMKLLRAEGAIMPDALFVDMNMPLKSGMECLTEIKQDDYLKNVPVIVYSTALEQNMVDILYLKGANFYVRKPGEYVQLKHILSMALLLISENRTAQPGRDRFMLQP